jgi:hypothetical protein
VTPFMRSVTCVSAAGMIGGIGVLMALPSDQQASRPFAVALPTPPATPCARQAWPNIDRGCLKWTALRQDVAEDDLARGMQHAPSAPARPTQLAMPTLVPSAVDGAPQIPASPPPSARRDDIALAEPPGTEPRLQPPLADRPAAAAADQDLDKTRARTARRAQRGGSEMPRLVRGLKDNLSDIPVTAFASDGTRRTIVIRPTSMQDVYYYARRNVATR